MVSLSKIAILVSAIALTACASNPVATQPATQAAKAGSSGQTAAAVSASLPAIVPAVVSSAAPAPVTAAAPAASRPAAPPPPPPAAATKVSYASDVFIASGSTLTAENKEKLSSLIPKIKAITLEVIIVVGHTDSMNDSANQVLSEKRAESVRDYLISQGIDKNRIYTDGKGSKQPVADNKIVEGRAMNNRVEIEAIGTQKN